uniref:GST N-terminal domain-containing protein n=1 Tax=Bionectria ochroleuca TaxID=29856 RepID=A0A8H7K576_BIOOC
MAELAINPNSRIPALTDVDKNSKEIQIFESGAILEYLVAQYDKNHKISYPYNSPEVRRRAGPLYSQLLYPRDPSSLPRLSNHLAASPSGYIISDRVTIADIAIWPWVGAYKYSGLLSIDEFPHVKKWLYTLLVCPGFEEGCNAPGPHRYLNMNDISEEELNSIAASLGTWIIDAMKRDAEA